MQVEVYDELDEVSAADDDRCLRTCDVIPLPRKTKTWEAPCDLHKLISGAFLFNCSERTARLWCALNNPFLIHTPQIEGLSWRSCQLLLNLQKKTIPRI